MTIERVGDAVEGDSRAFRHHRGQRGAGDSGQELVGGALAAIDLDLEEVEVADGWPVGELAGIVSSLPAISRRIAYRRRMTSGSLGGCSSTRRRNAWLVAYSVPSTCSVSVRSTWRLESKVSKSGTGILAAISRDEKTREET